jgi:hypothetical protein
MGSVNRTAKRLAAACGGSQVPAAAGSGQWRRAALRHDGVSAL